MRNRVSFEEQSSMFVVVQFHGLQRRATRISEMHVPIMPEARLKDVLSYLKESFPDLPLAEDKVLILVNNSISHLSRVLRPNDKVSFLPHIGGG